MLGAVAVLLTALCCPGRRFGCRVCRLERHCQKHIYIYTGTHTHIYMYLFVDIYSCWSRGHLEQGINRQLGVHAVVASRKRLGFEGSGGSLSQAEICGGTAAMKVALQEMTNPFVLPRSGAGDSTERASAQIQAHS